MNKKILISLILAALTYEASAYTSFSFGISSCHNYSYEPYYCPCYVEPCYTPCYVERYYEPVYVAPRRQTVIIKHEPVVIHDHSSSYAKRKKIRKLQHEIEEKERRVEHLKRLNQRKQARKSTRTSDKELS